ncbi:MAG: hypothetical protein JW864_04230 [Spirochaetes bacterium]|nr:hypothetical protein [Spirochaetota bacterium]
MRTYFILLISCVFFLFPYMLYSADEKQKDIAVVKAAYDQIENLLDKYKIQYNLYDLNELEDRKIFDSHRAIFFPCGLDKPIETNIDILSRGTKIHSVSLKKDYINIKKDLIHENIRSFLDNGGSAYFSGYSFNLLNGAFNSMDFYDNFPNLGKQGKIELNLTDELKFFCKVHNKKIYMPHPGWIVTKSIRDSQVLAESEFETVRGIKKSPIISYLKTGDGHAIYTSYHKTTGYDELIRFIIYRTAFNNLREKLLDEISAWEQQVISTVVDSVREWETYRSYIIPVVEGHNTLYFYADKGPFQLDIMDKDKNLLVSLDSRNNEFHIDLQSNSDNYYIAKVYPGNPDLYGNYAIASASGKKIFPYYKKIIYFTVFFIILFIIYLINRIFGPKKFSGR